MNARWLPIAFALLLALMIATTVPVYRSRTWVDPVTGSRKTQAAFLIFWTSPEVRQSEIERWIVRNEGAYLPRWRHLSTRSDSFFGGVAAACSLAPAIFPLGSGDRDLEFIRRSTDREIAEFVRIMRTGTEDEKKQAVEAAWEKILSSEGPRS